MRNLSGDMVKYVQIWGILLLRGILLIRGRLRLRKAKMPLVFFVCSRNNLRHCGLKSRFSKNLGINVRPKNPNSRKYNLTKPPFISFYWNIHQSSLNALF